MFQLILMVFHVRLSELLIDDGEERTVCIVDSGENDA